MQKIGSSTTTADENDEFTDGDPQTQVPCTWVMAAWLNTLQRELV
ncbi:phage tail protein, partial [Lelliottia aquatilis]